MSSLAASLKKELSNHPKKATPLGPLHDGIPDVNVAASAPCLVKNQHALLGRLSAYPARTAHCNILSPAFKSIQTSNANTIEGELPRQKWRAVTHSPFRGPWIFKTVSVDAAYYNLPKRKDLQGLA